MRKVTVFVSSVALGVAVLVLAGGAQSRSTSPPNTQIHGAQPPWRVCVNARQGLCHLHEPQAREDPRAARAGGRPAGPSGPDAGRAALDGLPVALSAAAHAA